MQLGADVVVVGGGMAGACAALAAREAGASVLLLARAPGASAVSSGAIDFAEAGDESITIAEAARLLASRPGHPYALFGGRLEGALDAALALLRKHLAALGLAGAASSRDRNIILATPLGRRKAAALAQGSIAAGDLRALPAGARLGVVAFCGAQAVEARLVATGLSGVVLAIDRFTRREDAQLQLPQLASLLDQPGERARLGESIGRAARAHGATHALVATVGLADPLAARAELERAAGLPLFELLSAPPSVAGLRLQRALDAALDAAGVQRLQAIAEKSLSHPLQATRGAECMQVSARAVVLASGRFLGGGIAAARDGTLSDSALGLPAFAGERRRVVSLMSEELFALRASGRHVALGAGLRADDSLRALDEHGQPAVALGAKVFAAGATIGGYDPARAEGGLGVAAVTGVEAGRRAAEAAR